MPLSAFRDLPLTGTSLERFRVRTLVHFKDSFGPGVPMLPPRRGCSCLGHRLVVLNESRLAARGFAPSGFIDRSIAVCGRLDLRLDANTLRRSRFWHRYFEPAVIESCLSLRKINFSGQVDDTEDKQCMLGRMAMFSGGMVFVWLGLSTDG